MKRRIRVFISYRRDDSAYVALAVRDELERRFGKGSVFLDVASITPGQDFPERIEQAMQQSDVLLVLIGDGWNATGADGTRLLDMATDFLRIELELGIALGRPIVPVLIGKARMPGEAELPTTVAPLHRVQAVELRAGRAFRQHLHELIATVRTVARRPQQGPRAAGFRDRRTLGRLIVVVALGLAAAYPVCIHDRLAMNHAVTVTRTAKLRPAPGTHVMPGTVLVQAGDTATYIDRSLRKYLLVRENGTYFDYWRKLRTSDGRDGWIYGAYLEQSE